MLMLFCRDKNEDDYNNVSGLSNGNYSAQNGNDSYKTNTRRRTLRSNRSNSQTQLNGNASPPQNSNCHNHSVRPSNNVRYVLITVLIFLNLNIYVINLHYQI